MSRNTDTPLATVIMAAGKGTRMKSEIPKVLHPINGIPMIKLVLQLSKTIGSVKIIVVVGYKANMIKIALKDEHVDFALQSQQLGTGHAVAQAQEKLSGFIGNVLVLSGDVPLLSVETVNSMLSRHIESGSKATVLTADMDDPSGYGRVIRDSAGSLKYFVEQKDASSDENLVKEINSGIYVFESETLFKFLPRLQNKNNQGEYYLPDVLPMILAEKGKVSLVKTKNNSEIFGVNTLEQLEGLNKNVKFQNRH